MVQQQDRVTKPSTLIERVPSPDRTPTRSSPWLIGGLVVMTLAVFALGGWTLYQRLEKRDAERLAQGAVAAWDSGRPAALADVYDPSAVLVERKWLDPLLADDRKSLTAAAERVLATFCDGEVSPHGHEIADKLRVRLCLTALRRTTNGAARVSKPVAKRTRTKNTA